MELLFVALHYAILGLIGWAIVDALMRPQAAFDWADTMKKPLWVLVLLAALIIRSGIFNLGMGRIISFILLIVVVYYLGPVRDKLKTFPSNNKKGPGRGSW